MNSHGSLSSDVTTTHGGGVGGRGGDDSVDDGDGELMVTKLAVLVMSQCVLLLSQ